MLNVPLFPLTIFQLSVKIHSSC